jgi:hypothetical protein
MKGAFCNKGFVMEDMFRVFVMVFLILQLAVVLRSI